MRPNYNSQYIKNIIKVDKNEFMAVNLVHKQYHISPYYNLIIFICSFFENLHVVMRCHDSSKSAMRICKIFFISKVDMN